MRRGLMTRIKRLEGRSCTDAPSQSAIKARASVGAKVDTLLAAIERGDLLAFADARPEDSPAAAV